LEYGQVWGIEHPNLTCPRSDLGCSKLNLEHDQVWNMIIPNRNLQFGITQIRIPIWDIPSLTWDMVKFSQQQYHEEVINMHLARKKADGILPR